VKKKLIIGVVVLAVLVGAGLGLGLFKGGKNGKVKYRTDVISKGDIEATVVTSGTLDAVTVVDVGSQVSGKIAKLFADFNSPVKAGQIVAQLDLDLLQAKVDQNQSNYESSIARLEQAQVTLDTTKKKYDRSLDLFKRNLISIEEQETAEANYLSAKSGLVTAKSTVSQSKSQLDSSKVDMSYAIIRSPIDGVVVTRNVNLGQTVAASMTAPVLFKVASDLTKMQLSCAVDEADIGKMKDGQRVRFTVDAFPGETFNGSVRQVRLASTVVQNVVTYTCIVDAENNDLKLKPGMTATVSVIVGEAKGVLKVPNSAMRFTPTTLDPKELEKLRADLQSRMTGGQGGPQGQNGQAGQGGQRQGGQTGQRQGGGRQGGGVNTVDMTPDQLARIQQMAKSRQRTGGTVWAIDDAGKLTPYMVRTGLTDNTYSELRGVEPKEGTKIITGEETPGAKPAAQQGMGFGQPNIMRMGGGR
jgi:HlyD family secretion protein